MARKIRIDLKEDALLLVDVQDAFMPEKGGLPVTDGEAILPVIARLRPHFDLMFASVDRHPEGHVSLVSSYNGLGAMTVLTYDMVKDWDVFSSKVASDAAFDLAQLKGYLMKVGAQVLWPEHAVEGSGEDEIREELRDIAFRHIIIKGMDPACDSYSAFYDNRKRATGLAEVMRGRGVKRVFVCGLAEDFCVGWSALDAVFEGFETFVIKDATRPVGVPPMDGNLGSLETIRKQFKQAGVTYVTSDQLSCY